MLHPSSCLLAIEISCSLFSAWYHIEHQLCKREVKLAQITLLGYPVVHLHVDVCVVVSVPRGLVSICPESLKVWSWLTAVHARWSIVPDITFLMLISPKTALERVGDRGEREHFEQEEFLEEVQKNYLDRMAENPSRFILVDAELPPETILDFVEKSIRERINRQ